MSINTALGSISASDIMITNVKTAIRLRVSKKFVQWWVKIRLGVLLF